MSVAVFKNLLPFAHTLPFRLPLNQGYFGRKSRAFPLIQPRKLWPGDQANGDRLTKGHFRFAGQQIDMSGSTWYPQEVGSEWIKRLHAFYWLDDLRASSSPMAYTTARALTLRWIEDHARYRRQAWEPVTLATRLTQWMAHFDFLSSQADPSLQRAILRSTMQQYRYLAMRPQGDLTGAHRIRVNKALIVVGLCLPGSGKPIAAALGELEAALSDQIHPDGSHVERCPATQMRILLDLIDVRAALTQASSNIPDWLTQALARLAGFLRLLQHADGRLANFQAEPLLSAKIIQEALQRADSNQTPLAPSGGASRFHRLKAGRTLLMVDAGTYEAGPRLIGAHASALAIELSIGTSRLITNCGNFDLGPEWRELQRTTAAHSTLVWNDRNSAELLPDGTLGRTPSQIITRLAEDEEYDHLSFSHDGYGDLGGGTHYRSLSLHKSGTILEGEDRLEGSNGGTPLLRFHLHSGVRAEMTHNARGAILRLSSRERGWRFEAFGAALQIGESVVADERGQALRAQQLILAPDYTNLPPENRAMRWRFYQEGTKP